jgi:hypothetical protein
MLLKFHKWYDHFSENTRLLILIAIIAPFALLMGSHNPILSLISIAIILVLTWSRVNYVTNGRFQKQKA